MRWMWIDSIIDFEPERRLVAIKNVSLAEEHLHDHFPADGERDALPIMPASLILEGMAQTAGILVGTVSRFREKVILAKIARAAFDADVFPGDTIRYTAELDRVHGAGSSTTGTVHCRRADSETWREIGHASLMFSHLDQNLAGTDFPEENFVFSDNFRTILRSAGLASLADDD